ncbi:Uncharacterized protein Fot_03379 [Forsythia ovata]|uniref:Uncharacterized protein n=1 Tax=Forsythia ovata TaxID=205694 RepID=A0ABD1XAF0_9LAMI
MKIHGSTRNYEITPPRAPSTSSGHRLNPSSPSCRKYEITQKARSSSSGHLSNQLSQPHRNYEITLREPSTSRNHGLTLEPCYVEKFDKRCKEKGEELREL